MKSLYPLLGIHSHPDTAERFSTSWLLPVLPFALLRLSLSLYAFTSIIFIFAWDGAHSRDIHARRTFSYFTNLSYWGLAFYFLFSGVHGLTWRFRGRPLLERWPRWLQALHAVFYTTIVTFPILVTVVYWAILYENPFFQAKFDAWANVNRPNPILFSISIS